MSGILVTYASRYGATREIAEDVAKVLYERGAAITVRAAKEISDLTPYDAVVLGSAVYEGHWLPEGADFLERFADVLKGLPLWLFSSGSVDVIPAKTQHEWTPPPALDRLLTHLGPRGHAAFGGRYDSGRLSLGDWSRYPTLRGVSRDVRDWREIEAWANEIANALPEGTLTLLPKRNSTAKHVTGGPKT